MTSHGIYVRRSPAVFLTREFNSLPPPVNSPLPPETTQVTRAVVGGGAKFYLNESDFVRSDLRTSFGGDATFYQFRIGIGVDF